jgi:hypothetical protein
LVISTDDDPGHSVATSQAVTVDSLQRCVASRLANRDAEVIFTFLGMRGTDNGPLFTHCRDRFCFIRRFSVS